MSRPTTLALLLVSCLGAACATGPALVPSPPDTVPEPGDIFLAPGGEKVTFEAMAAGLESDRVVFVGESHNSMAHHAFQAEVVRTLYGRSPKLLIGMEMFQRPFQPALDRFIAGESTEEEFLKETEYFTRWQWDWRYYRPILLFAREHGIPVIALNSPKEANRRVSQGGGLGGLTEEDRQWVAEEIDLTIEAHREFVMAVFEGHPMGPGFDKDAFYASQCVWEDTMAESVARALDAHPDHRMVVIVGGGHVRKRFGVPIRAERRGATPYSIVLGMDLHPGETTPLGEYLAEDLADVLFFTRVAPRAGPSPKLGVNLDNEDQGRGLLVTMVTPGSISELAGVAVGDRILALNETSIESLEDLRIALAVLEVRLGTITVLRGGKTLVLTFDTAWVAA